MIQMSIVTGTRHRPDSFRRFVESVADAATVTTQLIVADASDVPDYALAMCLDVLRDCPAVVTASCHHEKPRLGTAAGYNVAFRKATGRYVAWLNDDVQLEHGWDRIAVDYMDKWPEIGIGCMYFRDRNGGQWNPTYYVQEYHGMVYANFGIVRREVGERIGWFGETVDHYGVDNCISMAAIEAGYAVVPIPGCKCKHWREIDRERIEHLERHNQNEIGSKLLRRFAKPPNMDFSHLREAMQRFDYLKQPIHISAGDK